MLELFQHSSRQLQNLCQSTLMHLTRPTKTSYLGFPFNLSHVHVYKLCTHLHMCIFVCVGWGVMWVDFCIHTMSYRVTTRMKIYFKANFLWLFEFSLFGTTKSQFAARIEFLRIVTNPNLY